MKIPTTERKTSNKKFTDFVHLISSSSSNNIVKLWICVHFLYNYHLKWVSVSNGNSFVNLYSFFLFDGWNKTKHLVRRFIWSEISAKSIKCCIFWREWAKVICVSGESGPQKVGRNPKELIIIAQTSKQIVKSPNLLTVYRCALFFVSLNVGLLS